MDNLADKIINASKKEAEPEQERPKFFGIDMPEADEYGLPTVDSVDYFVARMIYIDQQSEDGHLHIREDGHIWKGDHWVSENTENLYRLCEWMSPIKLWQKEAIWRRLRDVLPRLSKDKFVVTDHLLWDRQNARFEEVNRKPNTIK